MKKYKSLEDLLDSVERIDNGDIKAEDVFKDIAENLFNNYVIEKGGDTFQLLEIEFYYYSKAHNDYISSKGKPFVYERQARRSGVFFFHDSGVDICFKTSKDRTSYGGILIRSLLLNTGQDIYVVEGPWDCRDALFNYTDENCFPKIIATRNKGVKLDSTIRYNADKAGADMAEAKYCFYDRQFVGGSDWMFDRYDAVACQKKKTKYNAKPWNRG